VAVIQAAVTTTEVPVVTVTNITDVPVILTDTNVPAMKMATTAIPATVTRIAAVKQWKQLPSAQR